MLRWLTRVADGWARDRFRFWDGCRVREVSMSAVIARMREMRPDLGRFLDRWAAADSPWSVESAELIKLLRTAFDVADFIDPTGHRAGLADCELMYLMRRLMMACTAAGTLHHITD